MRTIQVLGPGCAKCRMLAENIEKAAKEWRLECRIEKVTDLHDIMSYGVMMTPALVIDGEVRSVGKVLSPKEIKEMLW